MKSMIIVALALVAVTVALPVDNTETKIVRSEINQNPDGSFTVNVETDDGTKRLETGELKVVQDEENKPVSVVVVRGSYSYVDPEGKVQTIDFSADESGYHADGPSVPKVQS